MAKIHFIQPDGTRVSVEAKNGQPAMHAAMTHNVAGILGECGGSMACATCHVYVDDAWLGRLPAMSGLENEMLDATAAERRAGSRLSCQIEVSDALDGLVLALPDAQI